MVKKFAKLRFLENEGDADEEIIQPVQKVGRLVPKVKRDSMLSVVNEEFSNNGSMDQISEQLSRKKSSSELAPVKTTAEFKDGKLPLVHSD